MIVWSVGVILQFELISTRRLIWYTHYKIEGDGMVTIDDTQLDTLVALQRVVHALELRFSDHNGPFEYGTRLAEETGELIEVLYEARNGIESETQKQHLLKELQDVLRVVYGIAGLYNLTEKLPRSLSEFNMTDNPKDLVSYIVQTGVRGGELASAVNHAEGTGVKKEKHGDGASQRVLEKAYDLAQVVAWAVAYFDVEVELGAQIANAYLDYKEKGFIK